MLMNRKPPFSHLIERVEVGKNYEISIKFKVAAESLLQKTA